MYQTRGAHTKSAKLPVGTIIILQSAREEVCSRVGGKRDGEFESGRKGKTVCSRVGGKWRGERVEDGRGKRNR